MDNLGQGEAIKYDTGKPAFDLLPPDALNDVAQVFTRGAEKYARHNWRKGFAWSRVYAALQRHLHAWAGGQDRDPETGLLHLAQAAWGCLVLLTFRRLHPDLDDRPPKVPGWPPDGDVDDDPSSSPVQP